jgi:hypothetical protein
MQQVVVIPSHCFGTTYGAIFKGQESKTASWQKPEIMHMLVCFPRFYLLPIANIFKVDYF